MTSGGTKSMGSDSRASGRRGFTLLELMLVMLVIAVLGALVAPRLSGNRDRRAVEDQARGVAALCKQARSRAALEGRTYLVVIDPLERTSRLARRRDPLAAAEQGALDPEQEVPGDATWSRAVPLDDDVKVASATRLGEVVATSTQVVIAFRPDGDADAATLVLEGPRGDRCAIVVDGPLGLAHIHADVGTP